VEDRDRGIDGLSSQGGAQLFVLNSELDLMKETVSRKGAKEKRKHAKKAQLLCALSFPAAPLHETKSLPAIQPLTGTLNS
jgi:hypothetical protein